MFYQIVLLIIVCIAKLYAGSIDISVVERAGTGITVDEINKSLSLIKSLKKPPFENFPAPSLSASSQSTPGITMLDTLIARSITILKKQYAAVLSMSNAIEKTLQVKQTNSLDTSKYQRSVSVNGEDISLVMPSNPTL